MSKYIPGNHKHLTASDRLYIERALNDGISFKEIARHLCKDPSTIRGSCTPPVRFLSGKRALPECQKLLCPPFPLPKEKRLWKDYPL